MYKVFSDGYTIYDYRLEKYKIFDAKLDQELNKTGAFTFTIYPDNPNIDKLHKMKSIVTVYQGDRLVFRGRILNSEEGFYNEQQVTCEGELAFLLDSIINSYGSETEPWNGTPEAYLEKLLTEHNAQVDEYKRFKLGTVNVPSGTETGNITRYDEDYKDTWTLVSEKLVNSLGGYLWVRHEADGNYLDYLEDFEVLSNQTIEFGKNLLDLRKNVKGENVCSVIIPLGTKDESTGKRLTIESVNGGSIYLTNEEALASYGWICRTVTWDDVTEAANLLTKSKEYIESTAAWALSASIELTAADLAGIEEVNPFMLGRYVSVKDSHHGLEEIKADLKFLIKKISIDILNPANNTLTINDTYETFTSATTSAEKAQGQIVEKVEKIEKNVAGFVTEESLDEKLNAAKAELTEQNSSSISQTATEIITQVSQEYYLKSDTDALVASLETQFKQTEEEFEFRFNDFVRDIDAVEAGTDAKFKEINQYIRFVDGNIVLGEEGNSLTLKIENDRISFLEGGAEVAYLSNRKLYVTDGEFLNSMALGTFAFIPRANGNVSFKKVK